MSTSAASPTVCLQCTRELRADEPHIAVQDGVFCESCAGKLQAELARIERSQSEGVNYPLSAVGGVLGGALGVLAWWGFTVMTKISFGLVAVVIGVAVGQGVLRLGGYRRALGLQVLSAAIATVAFGVASFLVNRSFYNMAAVEQGFEILPLVPPLPLVIEVLKMGASPMDLLFLGIVLYEAWRIPAPLRLT
ncbi:hypothetical protein L6R49_23380 [Myxococcota bacterium]|nr:hypothetical protein [Myxococcota bacterium]